MPPRRAAAAGGSKGKSKETTKATTPSVLNYFSADSSSKPAPEPTVTNFEISPLSGSKPIKVQHYTIWHSSSSADGSREGTPTDILPVLLFTHGAGGGMSNAATSCFAMGAAATNTPSLVFEGGFNLAARTKQYQAVVQHFLDAQARDANNDDALTLGGRSLGARAAVQTVNARNAGASSSSSSSSSSPRFKTLVLVSYPLTSPSGDMRDAILCNIDADVDVLFVSGDRDSMCNLDQLNRVRKRMSAHTWLAVVRGADHGMSVKPASAVEARRKATGALAARWIVSRDRERTECVLSGTEVEEWTAAPEEEKAKSSTGAKRKAEVKAPAAKAKKAKKTR